MHFSGRVRVGEVMPLDRGLPTAGKGKSVEAIVDGVGGKEFAFPWRSVLWKFKTVLCWARQEFQKKLQILRAQCLAPQQPLSCLDWRANTPSCWLIALWEDKGNLHAGVQSRL